MAKLAIRGLAAVIALTLVALATTADEPADDAAPAIKLVGTWRQISAKYGGQEHKFPEGVTTLKHVTPTQFTFLSYDRDGNVLRSAGGGYTLKDDVYEETPEYGIGPDFQVIKGKPQTFTWKIEGNKWYHTGKLSNGLTIEEVLERVESK